MREAQARLVYWCGRLLRWQLVFIALSLGFAAWAADQYQVQGIDPYGGNPPYPTSASACLAGRAALYSTQDAACQAVTGYMSSCDRDNASYRNYVASLNATSTSCHVSWEFLDNGTTGWRSWSGDYPVYTCPDTAKARPQPNVGCAPVKQIDFAQLPQSCGTTVAYGNPIFPLTGAKKDYVHAGLSLAGIELTLTYDTTPKAQPNGLVSVLKDPASFGALWKTNFHHKLLVVGSNKAALVSRGDGDVLYFEGGSSGFTPTANLAYRLTQISGGYLLSDLASGTLESFDSSGKLTSMSTGEGRTLTFSYGGDGTLRLVQADDGRTVSFVYTNGLLTKVVGADAGTLQAAYDTQGNLSTLTWQDSKVLTFLYENTALPWAMTGKVDENNSRLATFAYDADGRAISTEYAGGAQHYAVSYGAPPAMLVSEDYYDATNDIWVRTRSWQAPTGTSLTRPDGQTSAIEAQVVAGMPALTSSTQPAGSGCAAATNNQSFDANGNVLSRDGFDGTRTCFAYDASNRETARVEGLATTVACASVTPTGATLPAGARRILTTWHPDWNKPLTITEALKKTTIVYHGQPDPFNGNATANCTPAGNRADGKPLPLVCKRVEQALTSGGGIDSSVPVLVASFSYDAAGRQLSASDANVHASTSAYYTSSLFDGIYDSALASVSLLVHANAAPFVDSSPAAHLLTASSGVSVSAAAAKYGGASASFNGSDAYISVPTGAADFGTDDFTVEGWAYLSSAGSGYRVLVNARYGTVGLSIRFGDSGFGGRLQFAIDDTTLAGVYSSDYTQSSFAGAWHHVAFTRASGVLRSFVDGSQLTLRNNNYAGPAVTSWADARSVTGVTQLLVSTTGASSWVGYVDDFRITKGVARYITGFTPPAQQLPDIALDRNATGHTIGDLQTTTNAAGHVTQFTLYDPAGRLRQMVDPKGITTDITYTPRGWVSTVAVTPPGGSARTTSYTYDSVGQVTAVSLPDGTSVSYSYDAAHRLTGASDARGNSVTYTLDDSGNRIGEVLRDPGGVLQRSVARAFDALNRLQQVSGALR